MREQVRGNGWVMFGFAMRHGTGSCYFLGKNDYKAVIIGGGVMA
jgi:hypothetical protein